MANQMNDVVAAFDTATNAGWNGTRYVRLFQWIELNEDLADGDMCKFIIGPTGNRITLESEVQVETTANYGTIGSVIWQIGPFERGLAWENFTLSVIDSGAVHIWFDDKPS